MAKDSAFVIDSSRIEFVKIRNRTTKEQKQSMNDHMIDHEGQRVKRRISASHGLELENEAEFRVCIFRNPRVVHDVLQTHTHTHTNHQQSTTTRGTNAASNTTQQRSNAKQQAATQHTQQNNLTSQQPATTQQHKQQATRCDNETSDNEKRTFVPQMLLYRLTATPCE